MNRHPTANSYKVSTLLVLLGSVLSAQPQLPKVALLKGTEIILLDDEANELSRLISDKRPKGDLRWAPDGQRLAYQVRPDAGAKGHLVVVGLKGQILKEISIQPVTDPPSFQFRYIEDISWLTAHTVRIRGNTNNWNCGVYDIDVDSGKEVSGLIFGQCRAFVGSPDGKHVAYVSLLSGGSDEQRAETVEIDSEHLAYRSPDDALQVLTDPVWSEDSKSVAFIHKSAGLGEVTLAFLSILGKSDRVPLPSHFREGASLTWLGDDVAVRNETEMLVVSQREKRTVRATAAIVARVEQARSAQRRKQETLRSLGALRQKFGATECVALPE